MECFFGRNLQLLLAFTLVGSFAFCVLAEEPGKLSETGRKDRLRKIRGIVEPFHVMVGSGQDALPARLLEEPSLLYADNARDVSDSSLWIWELAGRPVGVTAVERNQISTGGAWSFEFASLSTRQLQLSLAMNKPWMTDPNGVVPRLVVNAPPVAATRALRAQQMRRLAERFAGIEMHRVQGRIELRRLSTPVYRQLEKAEGDGAIFVFAHGTNPEVVLSIQTGAKDPGTWVYSLGALAAEELFVTLDGQEVWREGLFAKPGARPNYINGRLTSIDE